MSVKSGADTKIARWGHESAGIRYLVYGRFFDYPLIDVGDCMISGVAIGVVKDNVDPEKLNRILVELPTESTNGVTESYWCRMTTPMAGKDRGWVCIPRSVQKSS